MFLSCKHGHLIPYGKAKTRLGFRGHLKCPQLKKMRKILAGASFPQNTATPLFPEDSSYYTSVDMSCPWQRGWTWWSLRSLPTILWFCGICTENILEQVFSFSKHALSQNHSLTTFFFFQQCVSALEKYITYLFSFVQTNTDNHRDSLHFHGKNNTLVCLCWGKMSVQGCEQTLMLQVQIFHVHLSTP